MKYIPRIHNESRTLLSDSAVGFCRKELDDIRSAAFTSESKNHRLLLT